MSANSHAAPFPLYLTPFERLMELDDHPEHPMAFVIQSRLLGTIDRGAFDAALRGALARHPLLSALVKRRKKGQWCWVAAGDVAPPVDWADDDRPLECPEGRETIDLDHEVGLRVWLRQTPGVATLTLQFHHACCDGVGAYRFIGDLLAIYGELTTPPGEERPRLEPVNPGLLRGRAASMLEAALGNNTARLAWRSAREAWNIVFVGATPLANARVESRAAGRLKRLAPFPSVCSRVFERDEHEQLRQAAMARGAMLNDLLLAELFQTARAWNERVTGRGGAKFRVMMPTDMRSAEDLETPACNKVSYTFLTRRAKELDDPEALLLGIRRETVAIKNERRGARFGDMLALGARLPGVTELALRYPFCMGTAILSNVGDPSRRFTARMPRRQGRLVCGNLVLDDITGAPPMRRLVRATVSVFAYNRRLTLCARCNPFGFTAEDAQAFVDLYGTRLETHLTPTIERVPAIDAAAAAAPRGGAAPSRGAAADERTPGTRAAG